MGKLEARIRVHGNTGIRSLFEIAVDDFWRKDGCSYGTKEAFCILYFNELKKGKIVEAKYRGGRNEFREKVEYDNAPLVDIPESIVKAAWTPIELSEEIRAILKKAHGEKADEMIEMSILQPPNFKPLSDGDLKYIKDNCFFQK